MIIIDEYNEVVQRPCKQSSILTLIYLTLTRILLFLKMNKLIITGASKVKTTSYILYFKFPIPLSFDISRFHCR